MEHAVAGSYAPLHVVQQAQTAAEPKNLQVPVRRFAAVALLLTAFIGAAAAFFGVSISHLPKPHGDVSGLLLVAAAAGDCSGEPGVISDFQWSLHVSGIHSIQECCSRCQGASVCQSWTWVIGTSKCWLKGGGRGKQKQLEGVVTGYVAGREAAAQLPQYTFNYEVSTQGAAPWVCPSAGPAPELWAAKTVQAEIKVSSYNLEWWSLFDKVHAGENSYYKNTPGNTGTQLVSQIAASGYDLMAFQECLDGSWVLEKAGLAGQFTLLSDEEGLCLAFRTAAFVLLGQGQAQVAQDGRSVYWGKRDVLWLRLQHQQSGARVLLANHHGPLPTNSGGQCGEAATASAILTTLAQSGQPGDAVILVGDFNANAGGMTVQTLKQHLKLVFQGTAEGGVDLFFSNVEASSTVNLGGAGSDHDALGVALQV